MTRSKKWLLVFLILLPIQYVTYLFVTRETIDHQYNNNIKILEKSDNYQGSSSVEWEKIKVKNSETFVYKLKKTKYSKVRPQLNQLLSLVNISDNVYEKNGSNLMKVYAQPQNYDSNTPDCPAVPKNLTGRLTVNLTPKTWDELLKNERNLTKRGGRNWPNYCRQRIKIAIIICYRNRDQHLRSFLKHMHPFLRKQKLDYSIVLVEQMAGSLFNRGMLFNIGFIEMKRMDPSINCFIFHDVDLIPEDDRNLYICGKYPRHLTVAIDKYKYRLSYSQLFGGGTAFSDDQFMGTNGFSNEYWGWGGEDDDLYIRVRQILGTDISRYPNDIARYKMIKHSKKESEKYNPNRHRMLKSKVDRFFYDGLHRTKYEVKSIRFQPLFTNITVKITEHKWHDIVSNLNLKFLPMKKKDTKSKQDAKRLEMQKKQRDALKKAKEDKGQNPKAAAPK
ncbi:hypothetical protein SNEBB_009060 [Seison nebaliae]|nr:hypothetical protein SNEBB_009060 [Seison nebaliae]